MKSRFLLIALFATLGFSACEKENDDQLTAADIEGTWNLTNYDMDGVTSIGVAPIFENTDVATSISNSTVTMTFNADGTWTSTGTYTLTATSGTASETTEQTGGVGAGTYTVSGGKLTLNSFDPGDESAVDTITFDTKSFSATKVELEGKVKDEATDPFIGLDLKWDLNVSLVLMK